MIYSFLYIVYIFLLSECRSKIWTEILIPHKYNLLQWCYPLRTPFDIQVKILINFVCLLSLITLTFN